ncbi:ArsR/SmtB family transcription factor [Psychrobacter sp. I-STPA10]|uniref:ArsR/SmtB family transcription factor n=1 Tax=Psychrobacter sp. I-STPA10 TaxID=2585769 RepID=UPI001E53AE8D|nr:metalloregulator ArsR/SmtB family transcription factor [Psychrobacter sp. I-STPA10]
MSSKIHPINTLDFFKALSDPTRLALLALLFEQPEKCVCELVETLEQPQPTVSRHLAHLKRLGIIDSERRGTWMWYKMSDTLPTWCEQVLQITFTHS